MIQMLYQLKYVIFCIRGLKNQDQNTRVAQKFVHFLIGLSGNSQEKLQAKYNILSINIHKYS